MSLGTPQYMSPEQATGETGIDARSDIYSLGAVTYEMLPGEPPHTGKSSQQIVARLLTESPRDIRIARPTVPPHVDGAVMRANREAAGGPMDECQGVQRGPQWQACDHRLENRRAGPTAKHEGVNCRIRLAHCDRDRIRESRRGRFCTPNVTNQPPSRRSISSFPTALSSGNAGVRHRYGFPATVR